MPGQEGKNTPRECPFSSISACALTVGCTQVRVIHIFGQFVEEGGRRCLCPSLLKFSALPTRGNKQKLFETVSVLRRAMATARLPITKLKLFITNTRQQTKIIRISGTKGA